MRRSIRTLLVVAALVGALLLALRHLDRAPKGRGRLPDLPTVAATAVTRPDDDAPLVRRDGDPGAGIVQCQVPPALPGRLQAIPVLDGVEDPTDVHHSADSGDTRAISLDPGTWRLRWAVPSGAREDGEALFHAIPIADVELLPGEVLTCTFDGGGFPVHGVVVDLDGAPVGGAFVSGCGFGMRTGPDGTFSGTMSVFSLETGEGCPLRARWADGLLSRFSAPVRVAPFDNPQEVRLVVDTAPIAGLGIGILAVDEGIRVTTVHPGTPAEREGLEPGDVIVKVDGTPTAGMDTLAFVAIGTGREGSLADLEVLTPEGERLTFRLRRERLPDAVDE